MISSQARYDHFDTLPYKTKGQRHKIKRQRYAEMLWPGQSARTKCLYHTLALTGGLARWLLLLQPHKSK